jgi:long-chain acyl-CoA synthetase
MAGPYILAGNHVSLLDAPAVLLALPDRLRRHIAIAALAGFYEPLATNPLVRVLQWATFDVVAAVFNVYPVPRESGFRESLRYSGWLVDRGWSLMILPEGTRSWTGQMGPFRAGIGLLASELKVPVVPFRIEGTFAILPRGAWLPRPGPIAITFGKPRRFPPMSYGQITREVERAVADLARADGRGLAEEHLSDSLAGAREDASPSVKVMPHLIDQLRKVRRLADEVVRASLHDLLGLLEGESGHDDDRNPR